MNKENRMSQDTAIYIAAVLALMLAVLAGFAGEILMAAIAALSMVYIVPAKHLRKMLGYQLFTDVLFTWWLVGVASATLGGFTIAVCAGLIYSIGTREIMAAWGSERISISGSTSYREQFALLAGQSFKWIKALARGVTSGTVVAPAPLEIKWAEHEVAGGFAATRTAHAIKEIWSFVTSTLDKSAAVAA